MIDPLRGSAWRGSLNPNPRPSGSHNPNPWVPSAFNPNPWMWAGLNPNPWNWSALNPNPRPAGGHNPNPQRRAGLNPNPWQAGGHNPNPASRSAAAQAVLPPGLRWEQLDPDWVYEDGDGLLATGLRRSGHELAARVRSGDSHPRPDPERLQEEDRLLRWGPAFRAQAVLAELGSVFHFDGQQLSYLKANGAGLAKEAVFSISGLNAKFDWSIQIDKVLRAAVEREERLPEILSQRDDFWAYFDMLTGLPLERLPRTAELMSVAYQWAVMWVMGFKHAQQALRPHQRSPLVMPAIETPAHGSLPSGHATMAALYARLLIELMYPQERKGWRARQIDAQARRIAFNRVVAGVHFPIDSDCGYALGRQLAHWLLALARGRPGPDVTEWVAKPGAELREGPDLEHMLEEKPGKSDLKALPLLQTLWNLADKELRPTRAGGLP